ncbi:MAG: VacJ family lipoprotein [Gammaproteobacteria bacterium]|jgi:phospholipid-binding lipoprotein MlaA|nr:VacJ family lipoprotein [Gammaproteobacteria bacterium]
MTDLRSPSRLLAAAVATLALAGCASNQAANGTGDPYENVNRKVYKFNDTLDKNIMEPVAKKYADYTPDPVRNSVTNFFQNTGSLNTIANDLLQGKLKQTAQDSGRFIVNSTVGIGGLFDPATSMGLKQHNEDLGQTFGTWGASEGAYLMLPLMGASSARDVTSPVMDLLLNPLTYIATVVTLPAGVVSTINTRANLLDATRIRDQAALDPYTFVREAWRQQRTYDIYDGNPPGDGYEDYIEGQGDAAVLRVY